MTKTTPKSPKKATATRKSAPKPAKASAVAAKRKAAPKTSAPTLAGGTATSKTAAKAASSAVKAAPKPVVVQAKTPGVSEPALKKSELIAIVTERSGVKKKDAKPVVEAMLAVLGQALSDGRELNLQPFGKAKVNRQKDVQGGKVIIAKIRQSDRVQEPKDPLAKAAE